MKGDVEPCHALVRDWPGSRLHGFELDPALCAAMNAAAPPSFRYHARAIARARESRRLYVTEHPLCTSLYPPDARWPDMFQRLDVQRLKTEVTIETTDLDSFAAEADVGPVDFIKIDIQGAELEAFQGGERVLADTLMIVTEVEFVPLYVGQPLYADVDAHLRERRFMLHKFLGIGGRVAKPMVFEQNPTFVNQQMWSDAVYVKNLFELERLSETQLLKLAVLAELYNSPDIGLLLVRAFDKRTGSSLAKRMVALFNTPVEAT